MRKISQEEKRIYGKIAKLTGPIILQNLLSAFVTSADVVMLNFVGQEHISAVSLATQYATVLFMILYGLGTGVTMLSAQYFGKGDMKAVEAVEGIALRFSVGVTLLFGLSALTVPQLMMRVFTPDQQFLGDRVAAKKGEAQLMYFVNGVIDEVLADGSYESWMEEARQRAEELGL